MSGFVVLIVLFGALLHASWNVIVKSGTDKYLNAVLVCGAAGLVALVLIPFLPLPLAPSWPYMIISTVFQVCYLFMVAAAYSNGDMSLAYPLMRGTPPLLVAMAAGPLIGEVLGAGQWLAIGFISCGVLTMALGSRRKTAAGALGSRQKATAGQNTSRTVIIALVNALFIAGYTLVDGIGVRVSGNAISYTLWAFLFNAIPVVSWGIWKYRGQLVGHIRQRGHLAMIGGAGTLGSYGLALWAMTMAPVAMVAALRETSILFGMILSLFLLREHISMKRLAGALLIVCGTVLMRLV
ncbi:EamA family transporter [Pseudochrobactrum algeriensis]|uniref:DMT family transporter n=1 Tax=Pseudochrobactrum algeriensis TaxID=2834768 RepID=UPI001BD04533|nr:DMT family transporter [Pseudochrobactrum algeriensis]MBX8813419.1 EamA family transporter [Ochrobactrum sp. MR34]QVQ37728.1 EamA family transporter [Pseudochrobactrum algeriensis]QVQ40948.1 EamA family transporter [Pseudochrobactrum algeriensis]QVQ44872.1 EamA family transporter [Pseudochrobactrum algeriensis]